MKKLIDVLPIRESTLSVFCEAFHWYNEIYSRKIKLPKDALGRIFERIHTKALEVYDYAKWDYLKADNGKFVYSEKPEKEAAFPLVAVLITYGNAILEDDLPEIAFPGEPKKATAEFLMFFIYSYAKSMKASENITTLLPPELISFAIDPIVKHLKPSLVYEKDMRILNSLNVNLIFDILRINNSVNQAHNLERLYNQPALNKIWSGKINDTMVGMIMLDGDKFRLVNNNCGHVAGDEVLEIYRDSILRALELSIKIRTRAFPARWGGEEFCVCVFDCSENEIIDLSKKIKSELESHEKWEDLKRKEYKGQKEKVAFPRTVSQGIAFGQKSAFSYLNALVEIADEQMYMAKNEGGRDCIYYKGNKI